MVSNVTKHRVCFEDTDSQDIVYFGKYFRFFEIGRNELFRFLGLDVKKIESGEKKHLVHHLSSKYYAPAKFDDFLELTTNVAGIRNSSYTLEFELKNQKNELLNKSEIVYVFVDKNGKKMPMPRNVRQKLEK